MTRTRLVLQDASGIVTHGGAPPVLIMRQQCAVRARYMPSVLCGKRGMRPHRTDSNWHSQRGMRPHVSDVQRVRSICPTCQCGKRGMRPHLKLAWPTRNASSCQRCAARAQYKPNVPMWQARNASSLETGMAHEECVLMSVNVQRVHSICPMCLYDKRGMRPRCMGSSWCSHRGMRPHCLGLNCLWRNVVSLQHA